MMINPTKQEAKASSPTYLVNKLHKMIHIQTIHINIYILYVLYAYNHRPVFTPYEIISHSTKKHPVCLSIYTVYFLSLCTIRLYNHKWSPITIQLVYYIVGQTLEYQAGWWIYPCFFLPSTFDTNVPHPIY